MKLAFFFSWECHKKTFSDVLFHSVLTLIPLLAAIIFVLFGKWQGWSIFWQNGEFYIYSVVFLTSALHILLNLGRKDSNAVTIMGILIIVCLTCAAFAYGSLTFNQLNGDFKQPPVASVLKITSLCLLASSLAVLYIMSYWKSFLFIEANKSDGRDAIDDIIARLPNHI